MLKGDGREFVFFSMLKRDERGIFFLQVHKFTGGVRVGLIN
jgi:hypothetical protein